MAKVEPKLQDRMAYPPRGMRCERAAAYLGMSVTTFMELVEAKVLPRPTRIRGMVVWDRLDLDAAFENLKGPQHDYKPRENSIHRILGIDSRQDDKDD